LLKYLYRYASLSSALGLKVQNCVSAQARSAVHRTHILVPPGLQDTQKYKSQGTEKMERKEYSKATGQ